MRGGERDPGAKQAGRSHPADLLFQRGNPLRKVPSPPMPPWANLDLDREGQPGGKPPSPPRTGKGGWASMGERGDFFWKANQLVHQPRRPCSRFPRLQKGPLPMAGFCNACIFAIAPPTPGSPRPPHLQPHLRLQGACATEGPISRRRRRGGGAHRSEAPPANFLSLSLSRQA